MANSPQDPTGQARNRKRAARRLRIRLDRAERSVKALFRSLPKTSRRETPIANAERTTVYDYDFDSVQFQRLVERELNRQLLETQTDRAPADWFWDDDIELPYRQGTVEETRDFNELITAAVAAGVLVNGFPPQRVPPEQVLLSEPYQTALGNTQTDNFRTIKGLSDRTTGQIMQRVTDGVRAGQTPTFIANEISGRFDVARSSAKRIADTEINRAYNNARLDATRLLGERTGLRSGVVHISALLPTTRDTHAARHGNAYTVADQLQWWDTGANRINCHCSTRSILVDNRGNVLHSDNKEVINAL